MCKTRTNPAQTIIGRLWGRLLTDPDQPRPDNPTKPAPNTSTRGGKTRPNRPANDPQTIQTTNPGQTNPPPYLPPYLRQPAPISGGGSVDQKTTTLQGPNDQTRINPPTNPANGAKQTTRGQSPTDQTNGAKQPAPMDPAGQPNDPQTGQTIKPNPRKTQPTPQTGKILKWALTNLAKPKKPRFSPGVVLVLRQFPIIANVKL